MSRLADLAKHLVTPDSGASTAWPRVRDTCNNIGWGFDPWQDDLGRLILAKDAKGMYASSLCVMSLPRQVGKTYLVGCIAFVLCMTQPGTTVIWTAHRGRTATETFRALKAKAKSPEMAAFIDQRARGGGIRSANGEQEIEFLNGSRILFGARDAGFGVGFADVGLLVLDEIQRATTRTMDDLLPTTNAAENPLVLCMGTPPRPTDDGEVFTMLRTEAISGESDDVLYVELGARIRFDLSDSVAFWEQLRLVNPSFPHRVGERAILRNKKGLSDDSVYREVFGLWDELGSSGLSVARWAELADPVDELDGSPIFGLDVTGDRTAWLAAAWMRPDGSRHVMLANGGAPFPAHEFVSECTRRGGLVACAPVYAEELERAGVEASRVTSSDFAAASGGFADAVTAGTVRHGNQEALNAAVKAAKWRSAGTQGERAFQLKDCPEVGPLAAAARALHALPDFDYDPLDSVL